MFGVFNGHYRGTPHKRISEGLFWRVFFLVFIGIIGGTPDKRISGGLFWRFFPFLFVGFYRHYRGDPCKTYFWGSILPFVFFFGVSHDKRISEGLFCPLFTYLWVSILTFFFGFGLLVFLCEGGFIGIIGGPLINVFLRVYCAFFFPFFVFLVFIGILGGTPDKRISEGLFWRLSTKFVFSFSRIKSEFVLCFWSFVHSWGGRDPW